MKEAIKNKIAKSKGYPSWKEMEDFIINHNSPVVTAQLLVSAMEEVCERFAAIKQTILLQDLWQIETYDEQTKFISETLNTLDRKY